MSLTINPNYFLPHFRLGYAFALKGMVKEAITEYRKAIDLSSGNSFIIASLCSLYYRIGKTDQADKLFEILKERLKTEYVPATSFFVIHSRMGEEEKALEWLKKACDDHDTFLPYFRIDPFLVPEGSRYMKLLKEAGLDF